MFPRGDDSAVCDVELRPDFFAFGTSDALEQANAALTGGQPPIDNSKFQLKLSLGDHVVRDLAVDIARPAIQMPQTNLAEGHYALNFTGNYESGNAMGGQHGLSDIVAFGDEVVVELLGRSDHADFLSRNVWCLVGFPWSNPPPVWALGRRIDAVRLTDEHWANEESVSRGEMEAEKIATSWTGAAQYNASLFVKHKDQTGFVDTGNTKINIAML